MADLNATLQILEPIIGPLNQFIGIIQYLVGGIFGLYLILVILRWYESRRLASMMRDVKDQLVALNTHFGVKVKERPVKSKINQIKKAMKSKKK
tara:strand:- start:6486 stop:6767 length:282 start_codon:yes stop_codon:yes gene_type:complete